MCLFSRVLFRPGKVVGNEYNIKQKEQARRSSCYSFCCFCLVFFASRTGPLSASFVERFLCFRFRELCFVFTTNSWIAVCTTCTSTCSFSRFPNKSCSFILYRTALPARCSRASILSPSLSRGSEKATPCTSFF